MKRILTIVFVLFTGLIVKGQMYDAQWVLGYRESVLDFRNDTLTDYAIGPVMPMVITSANICDARGNLLYYTIAIYIAGSNGNQLVNGDSINPCDYTNQWSCCGLNIPQAALFLPKPGDSTRYVLVHFSNDTSNGNLPGTLYYTQIRDTGLGIVEEKNIPFGKGIFRQGGITASRHANGRDWWIIMGLNNSNEYYKYLITPNGISGPESQSIGPTYNSPLDLGYSKFSQDGTKFVTSCYQGLILIMDFDRCNGEFSNALTIFNQACDSPSSCSGAEGVEISPNNKFLYITNTLSLNQFDLSLPNPQHDSIVLYTSKNNDLAQIGIVQIGPNGKLYSTCFNGGFYFIHAVNYPDLKGDSADYVDTAFTTLTANSVNFPNMINYNLGPLIGSGCDTINTANQTLTINNSLRIIPNPADKYAYLEIGAQGNYEFELLNDVGQLIATKETRQVDIFDTEHLASGVYFLKVVDRDSNREVVGKKVVVVH